MIRSIFSEFKIMLNDLVFGRPIPKKENRTVITIDIHKHQNNTPVISQDEVLETAARAFQVQFEGENLPTVGKPLVLPFEDPTTLATFTERHRELVYKYLLKRLTLAIKNNLSAIPIFQLGQSKNLVQITKNNYQTQLDAMMNWFVNQEDYETASHCRDLIRQIKSSDVVDQ